MNLPDLALCYNCGGHLSRIARAGRSVIYLGETYQIPAEVALLTCDTCGHEWTSADEEEVIEAACLQQKQARAKAPAQILLGPFRGTYTQRRAADLVGIPQSTLHRWIAGRERQDGSRSSPVLVRQGNGPLDFHDVAELAVLAAFRRKGVELRDMRAAIKTAQEVLGAEAHPFCAHRLSTDGEVVFARIAAVSERDNPPLVDLVSRNRVMTEVISPIMETFDFDGLSLPRRWWPRGHQTAVVIDPEIEFGEPVLARSHIPTNSLWTAVQQGDAMDTLAECRDLSLDEVHIAVQFERELRLRAA
jgi:uncharacterized protein (DUF433 family)